MAYLHKYSLHHALSDNLPLGKPLWTCTRQPYSTSVHASKPGRNFRHIVINNVRLLIVLEMRHAIIPNELLVLRGDRVIVALRRRRVHAVISVDNQRGLGELGHPVHGTIPKMIDVTHDGVPVVKVLESPRAVPRPGNRARQPSERADIRVSGLRVNQRLVHDLARLLVQLAGFPGPVQPGLVEGLALFRGGHLHRAHVYAGLGADTARANHPNVGFAVPVVACDGGDSAHTLVVGGNVEAFRAALADADQEQSVAIHVWQALEIVQSGYHVFVFHFGILQPARLSGALADGPRVEDQGGVALVGKSCGVLQGRLLFDEGIRPEKDDAGGVADIGWLVENAGDCLPVGWVGDFLHLIIAVGDHGDGGNVSFV